METDNRYPIYILSKGRWKNCLTAKCLIRSNVPFHLVVETQEVELYAKTFGKERLLVLPPEATGKGAIPVRNWIWEHSVKNGDERHWQLDDNLINVFRYYKGNRVYCKAGVAFRVVEDFTDRYENIGISGMNYTMFCVFEKKPFRLNCHVYSNLLLKNDMPYRFRGKTNADTDLCLQVLSSGKLCTIQVNAFLVDKMGTMKMKGGNTDNYKGDDGRLNMAKELQQRWPRVVSVDRRWSRPQHVIKKQWKRFDTPLVRRKDIDFSKLKKVDDYGLKLHQRRPIKKGRSSILDQ